MDQLEQTVASLLEKMAEAAGTFGPEVVNALVLGSFISGLSEILCGAVCAFFFFFLMRRCILAWKAFQESDHGEELVALTQATGFSIGMIVSGLIAITFLFSSSNWVKVFAPESATVWYIVNSM